jgi:hypothetical protein
VTVTRTTFTLVLGAVAALVAGLAVSLVVASPAPAAASSECGKKVLADWFDNGRIDRLYPLHCYEDAIDLIPKDLLPYADAEEVISRALAQALRGEVAPGGCDPSPDGSGDDCKPGGSGGKKNGGSNGGSTTNGETTTGSEAVPDVDTSAASSVPVPLLVLGGMSVALLAAGGIGYASRRRQGVDGDEPGDDPLG